MRRPITAGPRSARAAQLAASLVFVAACGGGASPDASAPDGSTDQDVADSLEALSRDDQPVDLVAVDDLSNIQLPGVVATVPDNTGGAATDPTGEPGNATSTPSSGQPSPTDSGAPPATAAPGGSTPTGVTSPPTAGGTSTTVGDAPSPAPGASFPTSMAAIRGSEQILLIDTTNGSSAVIASFSLGVDEENLIGPQFPFSVDVDPVSVAVRYDTCCDEAATMTTTIDLVTSATGTSWSGALPSVSPDGSRLAISRISSVDVVRTGAGGTGAETTLARSSGRWFVGRTAWSVDGRLLAIEVQASGLGGAAIAVVESDATTLDDATLLRPPQGRAWTLPSYRADGALVVVESTLNASAPTRIVVVDSGGTVVDTIGLVDIDSILDLDHDVTGSWLIVVDGHGDAFWFGPGGAGRLPGSGYTSASW